MGQPGQDRRTRPQIRLREVASPRYAVLARPRVAQDTARPATRLIMRCLEKDPADRFGDGRELAKALAALGALGWTTQLAREWWDLHPPRRSDDPVTDEHDRFDVDLAART